MWVGREIERGEVSMVRRGCEGRGAVRRAAERGKPTEGESNTSRAS